MEIIENGRTYIVTGDYPNGRYCKQVKNKGAGSSESKQEKIKNILSGVNIETANATTTNAMLRAIMVRLGIDET